MFLSIPVRVSLSVCIYLTHCRCPCGIRDMRWHSAIIPSPCVACVLHILFMYTVGLSYFCLFHAVFLPCSQACPQMSCGDFLTGATSLFVLRHFFYTEYYYYLSPVTGSRVVPDLRAQMGVWHFSHFMIVRFFRILCCLPWLLMKIK